VHPEVAVAITRHETHHARAADPLTTHFDIAVILFSTHATVGRNP
jgi:hypothetical protein